MRHYIFYDTETGELNSFISSDAETPPSKEGYALFETDQEQLNQIRKNKYGTYFDGKDFVAKPEPPVNYCQWNTATKQWEKDSALELEVESEIVRARRNQLLEELDPMVTNPLRWSALTEEQRSAAAAYRLALLDVPQQSGFPFSVTWPEKPEL